MYKEFESERLVLKPTIENDAELIFALMNTPKFIRYVGDRNISSIDDAEDYIRTKMLPQLEDLGYSSYTIFRKSDHSKVGTCGLYKREGIDGVDIGFGLLPEHEGFGYAFESANRILQAAYEDFGITEIKAITSKENFASQKLLDKLGLERIGTTKLPNEEEEILLYRIQKVANCHLHTLK